MTHGSTRGMLQASDGEMYSFEEYIEERILRNRTLENKPIVVVIQACRGEGKQQYGSISHHKYQHHRIINHKKDLFLCYATSEGNWVF